MKVSILLLTLNRYQLTKYCLEKALAGIGKDIDYELLILDNGSEDSPKFAKELGKDQFIFLPENLGVAYGFNKLLSIASGEYICFLSNDILLLNDNWLADLISYNNEIDKSGLTSIHCEGDKGFYGPLLNNSDTFTNVWKCKNNLTAGVSLINRTTLEQVGLFDERLGIYGREREQFAQRLNLCGFNNFYIPGQYSTHMGREINDTSDYSRMKGDALQKANATYNSLLQEMKKNNNYHL